jgi:hypothetical protein
MGWDKPGLDDEWVLSKKIMKEEDDGGSWDAPRMSRGIPGQGLIVTLENLGTTVPSPSCLTEQVAVLLLFGAAWTMNWTLSLPNQLKPILQNLERRCKFGFR